MRAKSAGLTIELDSEELINFWNVIMFALDLQQEREKQGKPCMTKDELALANELVNILDKIK